jgi:hypothetical protein
MSMPSSREEVATTARMVPDLELGLDFGSLGGGEGAVVGTGEGFLRQIVDEVREAFGGAAVVNEDEGGLALANDGEEAWRDGGPDGGAFCGGSR